MKTVNNKLGLMAMFLILFLSGTTIARENDSMNTKNSENTIDPKLSIEAWMVDSSFWIFNDTECSFTAAQDKILGVEAWMVSENTWENHVSDLLSATDNKFEVESWMIDENLWENTVSNATKETDLEVEDWMLENSNWK